MTDQSQTTESTSGSDPRIQRRCRCGNNYIGTSLQCFLCESGVTTRRTTCQVCGRSYRGLDAVFHYYRGEICPGSGPRRGPPPRDGPSILDIADSCLPQEMEYSAGWRDRMGCTERRCAGRHASAYRSGWRDADWSILVYGSAGIVVKGG